MSVYFTVNLEAPSDKFDPGTGFPSNTFERLLDIATEHKIPSPDRFISKLCEKYLEEEPPPDLVDRWFSVDEGLEWSRTSRALLASHPDDPELDAWTIECLDEFDSKLQDAKLANSRWNFYAF